MSSMGDVVVVVLAVALLLAAGLLVRFRYANPWPPIVLAMLTSGACFTVGGDSVNEASGPSVATVSAAIVAVLSVAAAISAMVPRSRKSRPMRAPTLMAAAAIAVGGLGLLLNQLVG